MLDALVQVLRQHSEIALFLTLAAGYVIPACAPNSGGCVSSHWARYRDYTRFCHRSRSRNLTPISFRRERCVRQPLATRMQASTCWRT
jgi:hypothetical protein